MSTNLYQSKIWPRFVKSFGFVNKFLSYKLYLISGNFYVQTRHFFEIFPGCHFIEGNSLKFPVFPYFFPFLREFPSIKWQPLKISKIEKVTFWRHLWGWFMPNFRPLWRCCEELKLFAWFRRKRDFSLYKGNTRDFEGKMSGSGQIFNCYNFLLIFSEGTH